MCLLLPCFNQPDWALKYCNFFVLCYYFAPLSESTCCIYVKLFHYITLRYQNGEGRVASVCQSSKHIFTCVLNVFFIYLISCRCTVFQKQIYDVDMMKLISLSIQIFHLFVIFTWCNQHSCWCIISNCTCLTYTLQYQTYIGKCTWKEIKKYLSN